MKGRRPTHALRSSYPKLHTAIKSPDTQGMCTPGFAASPPALPARSVTTTAIGDHGLTTPPR